MDLSNAFNRPGRWLRAGGVAGVILLAACGGGGGDNTGDSPNRVEGGAGVVQTDGTMPASAMDSDSSFINWVKSFAGSTGETSEPVKVARNVQQARSTIGADETSEPVRLR